ncbi:MAG: phytoene desaturase [Bacteroidetes bacterium]|nr:phytoene desaturase [Bacteroidota bacterium]
MKKVCVIGAGFAGLAAAAFLAKEGYDVTVVEKNATAGGRARKLESQGYTFDMGPSWYWMPDVFEKFFAHFGKKPSDYYSLLRLDPSYRIYFSKDDVWDIPAGDKPLADFFESVEKGSSAQLAHFLDEAKYKYEISMQDLVYAPGLSLKELMKWKIVKGIFKLQIFKSVSAYVKKHFRDPRIVQTLEFPVLFLGASAENTPALYTLMNYADIALGTWYPRGGMYKIVEAMVHVAEQQGVSFEFDSTVEKITVENGKVTSLTINGNERKFDYVVAGADYHHVEQQLLPKAFHRYDEAYWQSRKLAPSSLIFYLGINKKVKSLLHHTLFFDQDFKLHAKEIYDTPQWPTQPLFYVSVPSKTDPHVAPEGHENIFILMPVATGLHDDDAIREKYFTLILDRLEALTGESISEHIVFKKSYAHNDFIADYNSFKGNAYGLANTLLQTAHLKPSMVNPHVENLYYTGQLTVPGPGVPPSLISGQIVAQELAKRDKASSTKN